MDGRLRLGSRIVELVGDRCERRSGDEDQGLMDGWNGIGARGEGRETGLDWLCVPV